ncbi:MAG TPA: hypothetical protein VNL18_12025 [Gemmatimonadales bacterium]|nr:hypothetical protein [Gemmatimonadales bacterium]
MPICAFFPTVAIYLGGMKVEPGGGNGFQQVLGVLLTFAAYVAVWAVLRMVLGGPLGAGLGGVVVPTVVATLALPLEARVGYALVGVKLKHVEAH